MTRQSCAEYFGTCPNGEKVSQITLTSGSFSCQILTLGATIRSLLVPDRNGMPVDVVLGYDTLEEYLSRDGYLGATIGRFANRIAGAQFKLNGTTYPLAANDNANHLHGGLKGFSHRIWSVEQLEESSAVLSLHSADGEEGYPGNLTASVCYSLSEAGLTVRYRATSDADTICSLTNHSYFNLSGHDAGTVLEQEIMIHAQNYTPSDAQSIPLGCIVPVEGTPMDLRTPVLIGAGVDSPFPQIKQAKGYDHNYVIDGQAGALRPAAQAFSKATGISMQVSTTLPGVHFYTANFIEPGRKGKGGCAYGPRHAFCLETQHFPDAPNQPAFPSALLKAGQEYDHTTVFAFGK